MSWTGRTWIIRVPLSVGQRQLVVLAPTAVDMAVWGLWFQQAWLCWDDLEERVR